METLTIEVRDGTIDMSESWVYVWRSRSQPGSPIVYVGSTGMPPVLRTWLHLNHEDPDVGRVGQGYPDINEESLTVLAFRLDNDVDRQTVKHALIAALARDGRLGQTYIGPRSEDVRMERKEAAVTGEILAALPS
ncbi:hypothetical protein [Leekyejoonella antrihumi]|uniref:GIY-YIG nuclease family protein n=1 Tax=Leekyejoonella antrihumi TaxID=1660198 RepID=A0A563E1L3_9MICO|nr:hypothetical protein [Leekyejoonella antrihumi]TWP36072.1 hypothetical protein FGL98_11520 [Leekyejoonella antrihumi]